jgi:hypothetical protein
LISETAQISTTSDAENRIRGIYKLMKVCRTLGHPRLLKGNWSKTSGSFINFIEIFGEGFLPSDLHFYPQRGIFTPQPTLDSHFVDTFTHPGPLK